jgi:hypothetical protein
MFLREPDHRGTRTPAREEDDARQSELQEYNS